MIIHRETPGIVIVLDNLRSAHNVGAIFRTADAFGVINIFCCGTTPTMTTAGRKAIRELKKTALGAEDVVPWEYHADVGRVVARLRRRGYEVVALEQHVRSRSLWRVRPRFPLALVAGNEVDGVSSAVLRRADMIVHIPMLGQKESLNVAVACGIALYAFRHGNSK